MQAALRKIKPFHPEKIKPPKAQVVGVTPDGRQLFREVTLRTRTVEQTDEAGNPVYRRNPLSGEALHKLRRPINYKRERLFFLESEGNGNIRRVDYRMPTEDEIREAERKKKLEKVIPRLAEALLDKDVDPEDFVARIMGEHALRSDGVQGDDEAFLMDAPEPLEDDEEGEEELDEGEDDEEGEEAAAPYVKIRREGTRYFDVMNPAGAPVNQKALTEDAADELLEKLLAEVDEVPDTPEF